jgi:hypothetical protein
MRRQGTEPNHRWFILGSWQTDARLQPEYHGARSRAYRLTQREKKDTIVGILP